MGNGNSSAPLPMRPLSPFVGNGNNRTPLPMQQPMSGDADIDLVIDYNGIEAVLTHSEQDEPVAVTPVRLQLYERHLRATEYLENPKPVPVGIGAGQVIKDLAENKAIVSLF